MALLLKHRKDSKSFKHREREREKRDTAKMS